MVAQVAAGAETPLRAALEAAAATVEVASLAEAAAAIAAIPAIETATVTFDPSALAAALELPARRLCLRLGLELRLGLDLGLGRAAFSTALETAATALSALEAAAGGAAPVLLVTAAAAVMAAVAAILGGRRAADQAERKGGRDHIFHWVSSWAPQPIRSVRCAGQGELGLNGPVRV
jgi:hypothetical protein